MQFTVRLLGVFLPGTTSACVHRSTSAMSCIHTARRLSHCMTYFERRSYHTSHTRCQLGPAINRTWLNLLLCCRKELNYCSNDTLTVTELFNSADDDYFYSVKTNSQSFQGSVTSDPSSLCKISVKDYQSYSVTENDIRACFCRQRLHSIYWYISKCVTVHV